MPPIMKTAFGLPCRIDGKRLIMPDIQSPPIPRFITRIPRKYSPHKPRSVRLLPSMTISLFVTGVISENARLE